MENHLTSSEAELEHAQLLTLAKARNLLDLADYASKAVVPFAYETPGGQTDYRPEALAAANVSSFTELGRLLRLAGIQHRYDHIPLETTSEEITAFWNSPAGTGSEIADDLMATIEHRCKNHPKNVNNGCSMIVAAEDLDWIGTELDSLRYQLKDRTISKKAAAKAVSRVYSVVSKINGYETA
ncbi:hypothetical protein [Roseibium sp.]|uniref:hypothetical protein n=1 Tax=Roseibium sp. TaxID=1936156 RepID=UPI00391BD7DB